MSSATVSPSSRPPESNGLARPLARLLAAVRRRARRHIWLESLALVALAACACGWTALAIDWLIEPPPWARAAAGIAALGLCAWLVGTRLVARLLVPLPDDSLALAVERRHPELGDSLSTAVDLARDRAAADVDHELLARTTAEAVARLDRIRPGSVFRLRRLATLAAAAAVAIGATAGAAAVRPALAAVWARRMLLLADEPWPRRVTLAVDGFPAGVRTVARGSDVEVVVHARAEGALPEVVELRVRGPGGWRTERMGTRGGATDDGQVFAHIIESINDDATVEIRGGDARLRGLKLIVADPPAIADLAITATLPDYLGAGTRVLPASRIVQVPRGSRIDVEVTASKPLATASVAVRAAGAARDDTAARAAGDATEEQVVARLGDTAAGGRTVKASIPALDVDASLIVRLEDTAGLTNRDPVAIVLAVVADEPPRIDVRLAGISTAVTPAARLPIEGTIGDDHGLESAMVSLVAGQLDRELPIGRVRAGDTLVEFAGDRAEVVPLEPLGLVVGGRLEVTVAARDGCPLDGGPNETASDTWTLDVVAPEALQAMLEAREILLRRRYEAAIDDLAQARNRLVAPVGANASADDAGNAARRCGEATARATGETAEVAAEFRGIRRELDNNGLLTPDRDARLIGQIADPLSRIATQDLAQLAGACRTAAAGGERQRLEAEVDAVLVRMREVLGRMLELESLNEVVERLRGLIRAQEQIRADTLERQRKRGREALEAP
jgi:hypothetical protein